MSSEACSYQVCVSKWGFWPAINEKGACGGHIHHDVSFQIILKYIYIMLKKKSRPHVMQSHWGKRDDWFTMSNNLKAVRAHMVKMSLTQPFEQVIGRGFHNKQLHYSQKRCAVNSNVTLAWERTGPCLLKWSSRDNEGTFIYSNGLIKHCQSSPATLMD